MGLEQLRRQYPVFERVAYLNAGTCGPLPAAALRAGADAALHAAEQGRSGPYFERCIALAATLRGRYARALGATREHDVALTTCASDGLGQVLTGMDLGPDDQVLTAPDEHPGLLGTLIALREQRGVRITTAPFERLADAVTSSTTVVACSHVNWVTGALAPAELAEVGRELPVVLDGAQGVGAIDVDVETLGCAAYAGAGQKWLCGPVGTGVLWVDPRWRERIHPRVLFYGNLVVPSAGLDAVAHDDARAFDTMAFALQLLAAAEAAAGVLEDAGWETVWTAAADGADELARRLADAGRTVVPRDRTTLVSFEDPTPAETVKRLAAQDIVVRDLPGTSLVRASIGAWSAEEDVERLLAAL